MTTGYSGTPLARKLGIVEGARVFIWDGPADYLDLVVRTDGTEDLIRAVALPLGWVDVKVCAVDDIWSGLKLMVRRSER